MSIHNALRLIAVFILLASNARGQVNTDDRTSLIVLKSNNHFPLKDLVAEKAALVVFDCKKEWKDMAWCYQSIPVYNGTNTDELEQCLRNKHQHLVIMFTNSDRQWKMVKETIDQLPFDACVTSFIMGEVTINTNFLNRSDNLVFVPVGNVTWRDDVIQLLFGAIGTNGKLPCKYALFPKGHGKTINKLGRLQYDAPEAFSLNGARIKHRVDSVVNKALDAGAFPGCRVMVAIKGKVIFNECYGYHTYDQRVKVHEHDVYDLASVTKIAGPLPLLMQACDKGLMDLDQPFANYWPDWQSRLFHRSNKDQMTMREVLAHQAGLQPYINYYPLTMDNGQYLKKWYRVQASREFSLSIDDHLYLKDKFKKQVYKAIRKSPLRDDRKYKYSGLSYMIYPALLTDLYQQAYDSLLYQQFYAPLGASSLCYQPKSRIEAHRLVPTEHDDNYRFKTLKGLVHDEAAAVMGGISGNAGLFASAHDLAKLMQMYLQKGEYAGKRYISASTFGEFTKVQFRDNDNRRGASFDKPLFGNDTLSLEKSYPAPGVSPESFGHSGFTGTFVWIDPKVEMVYIFLSNRVHPTRDNRLIYEMNVRPSIHQIFYDELNRE